MSGAGWNLLDRLEGELGASELQRRLRALTDEELMNGMNEIAQGRRPAFFDSPYAPTYYSSVSDEEVMQRLRELNAKIAAKKARTGGTTP